jgi:hypothetical protein
MAGLAAIPLDALFQVAFPQDQLLENPKKQPGFLPRLP